MRILHITTHLGGGVGDTILGYLSKSSYYNEILSLGYTFEKTINRLKELNISYKDHVSHNEIINKIPEFDIILLHYWNHPLLYDFLVKSELPPCRLVIWSHISGLSLPNIYTKKLLDYPDIFVFTSPLSYKYIPKTNTPLYNIWSTCGIDNYLCIKKKPHSEFVVGYVGTIDYSKMHPEFIEICNKINVPNIKFVVVGHPEAIENNVNEKFELAGFVNDLENYYSLFDVFGYPLNRNHYGTCDLVLQIAMASGCVPVVLNNPMELTIVKDRITGIVANNEDEYVEAIEMLYNNPDFRKRLSKNARKDAKERFSLKKLHDEWSKVFNKVIKYPKTTKKWDINKEEITYKDIFLESLGEYGKPFIEDNEEEITNLGKQAVWQSETKGTVHNYLSYFPDDYYLKKWSELMRC